MQAFVVKFEDEETFFFLNEHVKHNCLCIN